MKMNHRITRKSLRTLNWRFPKFAILAFVFLKVNAVATACGIAWTVPVNHFDGVNEMGEFSYWRDAGQLDLGDGLKVPLVVGFKPNRGGNSWLGRGWIIPILESNIVQIDEKKFLLTQPDGITRQFWRKSATDPVLKGQGNWAGAISENTITLWADCGWKLVFNRGKIISFTTPKGRTFNQLYVNGVATELQEKGKSILKVEGDSANGKVSGLSFGINHISIKTTDRPRVVLVGGANVVSGLEKSLHTLMLSDDKRETYDFAVNEKMQPTLKISGESNRTFTWDPATGLLLKDGQWSYYIKPDKKRWVNAEIERINTQKQKEFWFYDRINGQEIEEGIDGVRKIKTWFTSGLLAGRLRKKEEIAEGKSRFIYQAIYDESGKLMRELKFGEEPVLYAYDKDGRQVSAVSKGQKLWEKTFDQDGRIKEETLENGTAVSYKYVNGDRVEKSVFEKNGSRFVQIYRGGREVRREMDNGFFENYEYDNEGRLATIKDAQNNRRDFTYGATGEIIEEYKNRCLLYKIFTDETRKSRLKVMYKQDGSVLSAWDWVNNKEYETLSKQAIYENWQTLE